MKNRKRTIITLIVLIMLIIIQSSCSLFPSTIERHLFFDSICWEDDNHVLMYSMVRKWINTSAISWGSETGRWDWSKGEIWRINVFTGEKELLLRREGDKYTGLSTVVKIDVLGDRKLISLDGNAYIMEGESTDWQEIEGIYEAEWINDNEIIGIDGENWNIVKYNISSDSKEELKGISSKTEYFTYNDLYKVCLISKNSSFLTMSNFIDINEIYAYNDTLSYESKLFIPTSFWKNYFYNLNSKVIITAGYYNNIRAYYLLELDSNNKIKNIIQFDFWKVTPNKNLKYFISHDNDLENLILYDSTKTIINSIPFLLDQLDE